MSHLICRTRRWIILCPLLLALGCVRGKTYRGSIPVEEVSPQPLFPSDADQLPPGPPCNAHKAADFHGACIAYIEFDDLGELRSRDANGRATQVGGALDLIKAAETDENPNERTQPVIMVFVHGWKHNASAGPPEDANVQGVKDFLNMLQAHYPEQYIDNKGNSCSAAANAGCLLLRHPVLGVYIGWRGNSVPEIFPITQTLSYFGRQNVAYRVGNTSLTDTLSQISELAHPDGSGTDPYQPFLLMMGHSFGGLVLERTLAQAFMQRMAIVNEQRSRGIPAQFAKASFADLIVYVNTAVVAADSKQVIDQFAQNQVKSNGAPDGKRYPFIVSISSTTDQATVTAVGIGHALPTLGMKLTGSLRSHVPLVCYEPEASPERPTNSVITDFSQGDFFMRTAPHFEVMQSHELIKVRGDQCTRRAGLLDDPAVFPIQTGNNLSEVGQEKLRERVKLDSFGPTDKLGGACYLVVPKNSQSVDSPRCNGTPYFVMEVPPEIIPDHGTIFTQRFFTLLSVFLQPVAQTANDPTRPQQGVIVKRSFTMR